MSIANSSFLVALWHFIVNAFHESVLGRIFAWCGRKWDECWLWTFFCREGPLSRAWSRSRLCQAADWVLNLPLRLLQWLYQKLRKPIDSSLVARFVFHCGSEAAVVTCWMLVALTCIHQDYYNHAYMLLVAMAMILLVYVHHMRDVSARMSFRSIDAYAICFVVMLVLSVVTAEYVTLSARYLPYYACCMIAVLALVHIANTGEQLLRVGAGLALGVFVTAMYGLYQFFVIGIEPSSSYTDLTVNADMPGRVFSLYDNPNALAVFLLLILPIIVALVFASRKWYMRVIAAGIFAVGALCIVLTYSRAGWIGLVAAAAVYIFFWNRTLLPFCVLAAIAALPLLPSSVLNRVLSIGNLNDTSTNSRFLLWAAGWSVFSDDPLTGIGLGADAVRKTADLHNYYRGHDEFIHAHNVYLQIGAEMGVFGTLSFVGAILSTIGSTARAVRTCTNQAARHIAIGGTSALVGTLVYGIADYPWTYPRVMFIFWCVFGLTLAAIRVCLAEAKNVEN